MSSENLVELKILYILTSFCYNIVENNLYYSQ